MAGRKPKGEIMTETEMIEANKEKESSRIYKAESMQLAKEAISQTVARASMELENIANNGKIDLTDINLVKSVAGEYIRACAKTATFPTMSGLARAFGCNKSTLYRWMKYKPDTATGEWLLLCHDLYTDVLAETALMNNSHPIVSIFLLKAMFGLQDKNVIEINQEQDDYGLDYDPNYKNKYKNLIGDN